MSHASLTRRVKFSARHRFWNSEWSAEENTKVFGPSADARYHGHDYVCDVTVRGRPDSRSGMVVSLAELDRILGHEVRDRFDNRTINEDVPEFYDGRLSPSGENLARIIFEKVRAALVSNVQLTEVTVAEDDTLRAAYRGD
jgi:6-pyruvoyltetrahydropterin/6-carboxytetrahydropterin synthase